MNLSENEKKRLLTRATYELIAEKGYSSLTLQDVAKRAGVSKGIILYYFDSKEQLFLEVLQRLVARVEKMIRVEVSKATDPRSRILAYVGSMFVGIRENRQYYKVYLDFLSQSNHDTSMWKFNAGFYADCRQVHHQIVGEAVEKGICRKVDLDESAKVIRSIIDGMSILWLFDDADKFDYYKQATINAVLAYLGM